MEHLQSHILSYVVLSPLVGAAIILLIGKGKSARVLALLASLINFAICLILPFRFDVGTAAMQFVEKKPWIAEFGISYHLGMDGISYLMVMLTSLLTIVAILSSWTYITKRFREYYAFLLLLEVGMLGVFLSVDLFLFYIFWEAMLIPMYFLIGIWGGERRVYAAVKFFIYTMLGSVLMLVAILYLYFLHKQIAGFASFSLLDINMMVLPVKTQLWIFGAFALAFAIKVPMFPFHTWLPDAHVEAPTAGSVILAGVLLKMGTYGFLRFAMPLCPYGADYFTPLICTLAVIGIIYGALVAMVQVDAKKLVAYSSVSHLGFVVLGIFAMNMQGLEGGIIQMVNHGFSTGALFLMVGMLYERRHTRLIAEFGGLAKVMPVFFVFFLITTLSSIGLPGLNGFVGEFLILVGSFENNVYLTIFAATGVILAAIYMLWMFQRIMFGELKNPKNKNIKDLNAREIILLLPMILFMFWIGIYSQPFLRSLDATVENLISKYEMKLQATIELPEDSEGMIYDFDVLETEKELH